MTLRVVSMPPGSMTCSRLSSKLRPLKIDSLLRTFAAPDVALFGIFACAPQAGRVEILPYLCAMSCGCTLTRVGEVPQSGWAVGKGPQGPECPEFHSLLLPFGRAYTRWGETNGD